VSGASVRSDVFFFCVIHRVANFENGVVYSQSAVWWRARCMMLHQRCLSDKSAAIKASITPLWPAVRLWAARMVRDADASREVVVRALTEEALCWQYYTHVNEAKVRMRRVHAVMFVWVCALTQWPCLMAMCVGGVWVCCVCVLVGCSRQGNRQRGPAGVADGPDGRPYQVSSRQSRAARAGGEVRLRYDQSRCAPPNCVN